MSNRGKVLGKIRALLDQAESTDYESEADAFIAKAEQLMAKYDIEEALVAAAGKPTTDTIGRRRFYTDAGRYMGPRMQLFASVAEAHGMTDRVQGRTYLYGKRQAYLEVWGYESDLEYLEMLVTSLLLQAGEAIHHPETVAKMRSECFNGGQTVAWKNAFMLGFAYRVANRVRVARRDAEAAAQREATEAHADEATPASSSVALALIDRKKAVGAAFKTHYPKLYAGTRSTAGSGGGSGYSRGDSAGGRASLGGKKVRGSRGVLTA